jgi:methylamine---glutamate N-methyltransferase subunit A
MCGIVGLYLKNDALHGQLGELFAPMLTQMSERGPDSAGIAVYREDSNTSRVAGSRQWCKVTIHSALDDPEWPALVQRAQAALNIDIEFNVLATHAVLQANCAAAQLRAWLESARADLRIMSSGSALEIYKGVGRPSDVLTRFTIDSMSGSHMIGHTRMATESAVSTAGAHPFNTGDDLCLVHNGSLSNHNRLRAWLRDHAGVTFQTQNDSEVAAGYLTWRLSQGMAIKAALEAALDDLDGFYTFAVGTRDGFSVLRDPIACKPAVMAETDDWVAMASEFRALAALPGVNNASVWEPEPATVYSWGRIA